MRNKGYTLVEMVLYIAFFSIITVAMIQGLMTAMSTYSTTRAYRQVALDGNLAMERIVREMRQATSINDGASTFGANPGILYLNSTDTNGNPKTVRFWVDTSTNQINVTEDNVLTGGVTSGVTLIDNLVFTKITLPTGVAVKIEMTVRSTWGVDITAKYYNTVIMRGAY